VKFNKKMSNAVWACPMKPLEVGLPMKDAETWLRIMSITQLIRE
jgi:hypothetical protein